MGDGSDNCLGSAAPAMEIAIISDLFHNIALTLPSFWQILGKSFQRPGGAGNGLYDVSGIGDDESGKHGEYC